MNDDMNKAFWCGMGFGALIWAVPLMMVGSWLAGNEYEARAIESKVGEYDSQTGVFQYKIMDENSSM
jgi:hypothetical protein